MFRKSCIVFVHTCLFACLFVCICFYVVTCCVVTRCGMMCCVVKCCDMTCCVVMCVCVCCIMLRCVVVWCIALFWGEGGEAERRIARAVPRSANKTSNQYTGGMYVDYVLCLGTVTIKGLPRGSGGEKRFSRRRLEQI